MTYIKYLILFSISVTIVLSAPRKSQDFLKRNSISKKKKTESYDGTNVEEAQKEFNAAFTAEQQKDYLVAINHYRKAIKADDTYIEAIDNLGRLYRYTGNIDSAIYFYKKSIGLFPKGKIALQNIGYAYMYEDNFEKAEEAFNRFGEVFPKSAEKTYGLAQVNIRKGDLQTALENINSSIEIYKDNGSDHLGDSYYLKGLIYLGLKDKEKAIEYVKLAKENGVKLTNEMESLILHNNDKPQQVPIEKLDNKIILNAINKVLETPLTESNIENRKEILQTLLLWTFKTDEVLIIVEERLVPIEGCDWCLFIFSIGWSKYVLEGGSKDDHIGAATYAIKTMNNYFSMNREFIDSHDMLLEFIDLELDGQLKSEVEKIINSIDMEDTGGTMVK